MMRKLIPTDSKITPAKTNGSAARRCHSLIESFVAATSNLESPEIFRKWAAIASIAATLEQKVWLETSSALYPNLYVFLVAHPGVGKTRTVRAVKRYFTELPEPHIAPTSVTASSLVDALVKAKRTLIRIPEGPLEYNSLLIAADELTAFMHKYDDESMDSIGVEMKFASPSSPHRLTYSQVQHLATLLNSYLRTPGNKDSQVVLSLSSQTNEPLATTSQTTIPRLTRT